jgi:hypothetical protein
MANRLYSLYKQSLLGAGVNLVTSTVKVQLVDTGAYTFSDTHQFLSSIPSGARIGTAVTLASKTVASGVFDAADIVFTSVPAGTGTAANVEALVIYRDTGDATTSDLIAFIDAATGLPVTPDGGNQNVTWPSAGIFNL